MKQGETGMSLRHAPGKFLVVGRFLEKIVSALLPFLTMLVSARFIDLVLNQRMEEAILARACFLSPRDTARVREGIRDEDRAFDTATGILKSSWYCPSAPQKIAISSAPYPSLSIPCPKRKLSTTLEQL